MDSVGMGVSGNLPRVGPQSCDIGNCRFDCSTSGNYSRYVFQNGPSATAWTLPIVLP